MTPPELPDVVGEDAPVHRVESYALRTEPRREGSEICTVRALGRLGQTTMLQKARDRRLRAHCARIRRRRATASPAVQRSASSTALPASVSVTLDPLGAPLRTTATSPASRASSQADNRGQCVVHASFASV